MDKGASPRFQYALGHSEHELARLSLQAEAFLPFTVQLFEQARIRAGMHILDVGCGAADVSFLAAELVGPNGRVVGVDRVPTAIEWATARARSREIQNADFLVGDPSMMEFDREFDAIVGRFVLMYYPDPVSALRRLARYLRPGGLMVFQEFDMDYIRCRPISPTFERATEWIKRAFSASGAKIRLGSDLYPVFLAAGLPRPSLRLDALIGGGADLQAFALIAETIQSLLPVMEEMGIANAAEIELPTLCRANS